MSPLWAFLHAHHWPSCFHFRNNSKNYKPHQFTLFFTSNTSNIYITNQIKSYLLFLFAQIWYTIKLLPLSKTQIKSCLFLTKKRKYPTICPYNLTQLMTIHIKWHLFSKFSNASFKLANLNLNNQTVLVLSKKQTVDTHNFRILQAMS